MKLKEAGAPQDNGTGDCEEWLWLDSFSDLDAKPYVGTEANRDDYGLSVLARAFTAGELIELMRDSLLLDCSKHDDEWRYFATSVGDGGAERARSYESAADALGQLYLHILTQQKT